MEPTVAEKVRQKDPVRIAGGSYIYPGQIYQYNDKVISDKSNGRIAPQLFEKVIEDLPVEDKIHLTNLRLSSELRG